MNSESAAAKAAQWALSKVGCAYSQAKRTQENIFDCSSLVARAYSAQGKAWRYGGEVPLSCEEVYDDDFELLWPADYAKIGEKFGGRDVVSLGTQPGDLQFLCTDAKTGRANRITHVAMAADEDRIVHARGKAYGVCTSALTLYSGKVCAIVRYNPVCALRVGMKGYRTLALQKALNALGAKLDADGEYGSATMRAIKTYQADMTLSATGIANAETLKMLGLSAEAADKKETSVGQDALQGAVRVTGDTVNIRSGPGTNFPIVAIARKGEIYSTVQADGWRPILLEGEVHWISERYSVPDNQTA